MRDEKVFDPNPPQISYLFGKDFFAGAEELAKIDKEKAFSRYLKYLADGNTKVYSRRRAGLSDYDVENKSKNNSEFRGMEERALEDGADMLEQEAIRRGKSGFEKPVWYKGERVGTETQYSDTLLLAVLKSKKAAYRESRSIVDATVQNTNLVAPNFDVSKYTDEELIQLEDLLARGARDDE